MDIKKIKTRDDIFKYGITASMLISISNDITEDMRNHIQDHMGEIWLPYTYGRDSVTRDVIRMPFYNFLMLYGDQGDIQGVKKYCSHNIDILNRDYNIYVGELFINIYGKDDPISKIITMFIYDRTYYKIDNGVIYYNTSRGERYQITPRVKENIRINSQYIPRRTIQCSNGDIILKTGFCFFYNCVPLAYYEEYEDIIHIIDLDGNFHTLVFDENDMIVSGFENLSAEFRIRNDSIMDVYDIYRLIKLGMDTRSLIRDYGFNYRVIALLDKIDRIEVWQAATFIIYKDGYVNMEAGMDSVSTRINNLDGSYSVDYDGRTAIFVYQDFINFIPIKYDSIMDIDGYAVKFNKNNFERIIGITYAA